VRHAAIGSHRPKFPAIIALRSPRVTGSRSEIAPHQNGARLRARWWRARARDYLPLIRSFDLLLAAEAYGERRVASRMHARTRVCRVIVINVVVISVISVISETIPRAALCPSRLISPRKYQTQRNCEMSDCWRSLQSETSMHVFHGASETVSPSSAGHVSRKRSLKRRSRACKSLGARSRERERERGAD